MTNLSFVLFPFYRRNQGLLVLSDFALRVVSRMNCERFMKHNSLIIISYISRLIFNLNEEMKYFCCSTFERETKNTEGVLSTGNGILRFFVPRAHISKLRSDQESVLVWLRNQAWISGQQELSGSWAWPQSPWARGATQLSTSSARTGWQLSKLNLSFL